MTARLTQPPESASKLVDAVLSAMTKDGKFQIRSLVGRSRDKIVVAQGHPVYNLGLRHIVSRGGLNGAVLTGWRFLLRENDATIAAVELGVKSPGGELHFSSITTGPYVAATSDAFERYLEGEEFQGSDWGVGLLRIPGLYVIALWAHDSANLKDWLVPIGPLPELLQGERMYSWEQMSASLVEAGERRLATPHRGYPPKDPSKTG